MTSDVAVHLICIAKRPMAGRVKTRLSPSYSPSDAARLATAALTDTLDAIDAVPALARTLAFDGDATGWTRPGWSVIGQRGNGLDERLAAAYDDAWALCSAPLLLVGMDTPQLTPSLLIRATQLLLAPSTDAVLGPAVDGGWWAMGLRRPDPALLLGVPMSVAHTGKAQHRRLIESGLRVSLLPELLDVDLPDDVDTVARLAPHGSFAAVTRELAGPSAG